MRIIIKMYALYVYISNTFLTIIINIKHMDHIKWNNLGSYDSETNYAPAKFTEITACR